MNPARYLASAWRVLCGSLRGISARIGLEAASGMGFRHGFHQFANFVFQEFIGHDQRPDGRAQIPTTGGNRLIDSRFQPVIVVRFGPCRSHEVSNIAASVLCSYFVLIESTGSLIGRGLVGHVCLPPPAHEALQGPDVGDDFGEDVDDESAMRIPAMAMSGRSTPRNADRDVTVRNAPLADSPWLDRTGLC